MRLSMSRAIKGILIWTALLGGSWVWATPAEVNLEWGNGFGQLALTEVPDGRYGPQALAACGAGEILILDGARGRVLRLNESLSLVAEVLVEAHGLDLAVREDCGFAVRHPEEVMEYGADGLLAGRWGLPSEVRFISGMGFVADGSLVLEEGDSRTWELRAQASGGRLSVAGMRLGVVRGGSSWTAELEDRSAARLMSFSANGEVEQVVRLRLGEGDLASVRILDEDAWGRLVLEVERFVSTAPIGVRRTLIGVAVDGAVEWSLELPGSPYAESVRDVVLDRGRYLILMASALDGVHLVRWLLPEPGMLGATLELPRRLWVGPMPLAFPEDPSAKDSPTGRAAGPPMTRSEVLVIADSYVQHSFSVSSCNVGTRSCSGGSATTPSWVTTGTQSHVPYKWGGFSSLSEFDSGLSSCKLAGDKDTSSVVSCAVGVDCSGFVSRAWNTTSKYGTATLHQVSYEISVNDIQPADIFNKAGSHVRMVVAENGNGTLNMVESYAGSNYWRVGYTVRSYSQLSSYTPRRYVNIVDDSGPRPGSADDPILVTSALFTDSNNTVGGPSDIFDSYSCAPSTDESGPEVFYLLELSQAATVTVSVSDGYGVDIDPHLLDGLDNQACLARNDTSFTVPGVSSGSYYIAADTWVNSSGQQLVGPYQITVQVEPFGAVAVWSGKPVANLLLGR